MHNILYSISQLTFSYGSGIVLSIDSLSLEEGAVHVMVGPNGSGKTTLLKLLDGLLKPSAGSIHCKGKPPEASPRGEKTQIYVHQHPYLFSGTVLDNITYGLRIRGIKGREADERVRRALDEVGLSGFEKRRSSGLSGGEAQRTAIARALVLNPEILLLDEPTASVDRDSVLKLEMILKSIRRDYGTTVVISTHDHPFGYRIADRLIYIDQGRVIQGSENLFKGEVSKRGEDLFEFTSSGISFLCPSREGTFSTAVLDFEDIILSTRPIETSARNTYRGNIVEIRRDGSCTDVVLDIGLQLIARLTDRSVSDLGLIPGMEVFTAFKASAIRLY